jgi:hypothetical protein
MGEIPPTSHNADLEYHLVPEEKIWFERTHNMFWCFVSLGTPQAMGPPTSQVPQGPYLTPLAGGYSSVCCSRELPYSQKTLALPF